MLPVTNYTNLTDHLMGALCNMLIHSLWQGVLLAAVAGLIVVLTKRASALARYNLLIGALALFVTGTLVTFTVQFNQAQKQAVLLPTVGQTHTGIITNVAQPVVNHHVKNEVSTVSTTLYNYINTHHNTIVLIWFLIICAKSIQFGIGLQGVYLLKRTKVSPVDDYWQQKAKALAGRLGITQTIGLLQSGMAKVPMVVGHLKPVILIPIGLLTALSTEEVEAILVHELAHIRRRDYLVNLLQSLAEILFFFNPAVLWISQLIKTERENCCDDMALAQTSSKVNYIRALVSCQEYQQAVPAYAMGFPGGKSSLVHRAKRMLSSRNHSLNAFEKGLITICLVVSGLCLSAFAEKDHIKRAAHAVANVIVPAHPAKPSAVAITGQQTAARLSGNALDTAIAQTRPATTDTVIKPATARVQVHIDSIQTVVQSKIASQINAARQASATAVASAHTNVNTQVNVASAVSVAPALGNLNVNLAGLPPINVDSAKKARRAAVAQSAVSAKSAAVAQAAVPAKTAATAAAYGGKYQPYTAQYTADATVKATDDRKQAIDDMLKDGLIKTRDNLSFKLSTNELIINDKKQPDDVYQKYRAKYVKVAGRGEWTWYYNYDTSKHRETNSITTDSGKDYDSDTIK